MRRYQIKEVFGPTIQGEGRHTGMAVNFVRFSKCNRWNGRAESKPNSICSYCDTDFTGGDLVTFEEILLMLKAVSDIKSVVITGGEPLLQISDGVFIKQLIGEGYFPQIETNGSVDMDPIDGMHVTVSPKQGWEETRIRAKADFKFLFPWIGNGIDPYSFDLKNIDNVYIQPIDIDGKDYTHEAFQEVVKLNLAGISARMSLQTHKYGNFQ